LQFVAAANLKQGEGLSASKCEEYLLLTELCAASMIDYLSVRDKPYPPQTVARIFFQTLEAVTFLHRATPAIIHLDLKLDNLLIDYEGKIKLCDFGSASTTTYEPEESWNMQRRTAMEEELARFTTPMYRSPEMLDVWSNWPVNAAADVWALGCVLYQLCFHSPPFEDGAKLAIINAKYAILEEDRTHVMLHDLVRQALVADPTLRPTSQQLQEHLGQVGVLNGWDLEEKIDFEHSSATTSMEDNTPDLDLPAFKSQEAKPPQPHAHQQSQQQGGPSSSSFLSNMRGAGSHVLGKVKESTRVIVGSLMSARGDLDLSVVTSKFVAMSFPADGIDLSHRNQAEEVRAILETHHGDHYCVVNLTDRRYPHSKFPRGKVMEADWSTSVTPSAEQLLKVAMQTLDFLGQSKQNVAAVHCLDGKSNTAMLFAAVSLASGAFRKHRDALAFFEHKRGMEPVLSYGQRNVLRQLEKLIRTSQREVIIPRQAVTLTSVILEPIPLFTKAGDGVRPYLDVFCNGKLAASSFKDYAGLKLYTPYDGEAVLKLGLRVPPGTDGNDYQSLINMHITLHR